MAISVIRKRDGRIVPFDVQKISEAIQKSFAADEPDRNHEELADGLAWEVYSLLDLEGDPAPTVEHVQDIVEQVLMREGYSQTAKSYILYRQERTKVRNRAAQGTGTIVIEPIPGAELAEQALAICGEVRDGDGCDCLRGFYDALAPAAAQTYEQMYTALLRPWLELTTGKPVSDETFAAVDRVLTGEDRAARCARQADYLCGVLGFDREPVELAQRKAAAQAQELLARHAGRVLKALLRQLEESGCAKKAIVPPEGSDEQTTLLRELIEGL